MHLKFHGSCNRPTLCADDKSIALRVSRYDELSAFYIAWHTAKWDNSHMLNEGDEIVDLSFRTDALQQLEAADQEHLPAFGRELLSELRNFQDSVRKILGADAHKVASTCDNPSSRTPLMQSPEIRQALTKACSPRLRELLCQYSFHTGDLGRLGCPLGSQ